MVLSLPTLHVLHTHSSSSSKEWRRCITFMSFIPAGANGTGKKKNLIFFPAGKYFSILLCLCYEISSAILVNYSKQKCPVRLNSSHRG